MVNQLPRPSMAETFPENQEPRYPVTPLIIARILLMADVLGFLSVISVVYTINIDSDITLNSFLTLASLGAIFSWVSIPSSTLLLIYFFCLYLGNTYRLSSRVDASWLTIRILLSLLISLVLTTSLSFFFNVSILVSEGSRVLPIAVGLFLCWAVVTRRVALHFLRKIQGKSCWLVVRNGQDSVAVKWDENTPKCDDKIFSLVDDLNISGDPFKFVSLSQITDALYQLECEENRQWSGIIIEDPMQHLSDDVVKALMKMRLRGICVYSLENYYEQVWHKIPPPLIKDDWFAFTGGFSLFHNRINVKLKRGMDLVVTALVLLLVLPLMVFVAIAIKLESKGPIFYSQIRTGLNGKPFRVHKFRSMFTDAEKNGIQWCRTADDRITRVGRIIRRLSVDELPQLWNVFQGEMSLIGPRPERPEFDRHLEQEIPYYNIRYLVKPGITGWYQVKYPYASTVEDAYQKVSYDLYYIKNYSLLLDLAIVFKTLRVVVLGRSQT